MSTYGLIFTHTYVTKLEGDKNKKKSYFFRKANKTKFKMTSWSNDTVLKFLNDYRQHPILWDTRSPDYRNYDLKLSVLQSIAKRYSCDVDYIKRKIKTLRTAFRREYWRLQNRRNLDGGAREELLPKWFGFNAMKFLLYDELGRDGGDDSMLTDHKLNFDDAQDVKVAKLDPAQFQYTTATNPHQNFVHQTVIPTSLATATTSATIQQQQHHHQQQHPESDPERQLQMPEIELIERPFVTIGGQHQHQQSHDQHQQHQTTGHPSQINAHDLVDYLSQSPVSEDVEYISEPCPNPLAKPNLQKRKRRYFRKPRGSVGANGMLRSTTLASANTSGDMEQNSKDTFSILRTNLKYKDEYDHFAKNLALRIRKLNSDRARSCVQHLISRIIFEAEMGKYDDGMNFPADGSEMDIKTENM